MRPLVAIRQHSHGARVVKCHEFFHRLLMLKRLNISEINERRYPNMKNRITRGALAASSLVLALQFGVVSPASAELQTDVSSVSPGGSVTFLTNAPTIFLGALFVNGEFHSSGNLNGFRDPIPWEAFSPCVTVDVTFRVYSESALGAPYREPLFSEEPTESADVEFVGSNSSGCDDQWGSSGGSGSITLEANRTSVSADNRSFTLTSNGDDLALGLVFVNGVVESRFQLGLIDGASLNWGQFSPCTTVDMEYRIYNSLIFQDPNPLYSDPYDASVVVEHVGADIDGCNPKWDAQDDGGSVEPLANTGSDASAVAGLTGVAGVAALAVAVAVARRSRRAQR
jgi:hypothetical protein